MVVLRSSSLGASGWAGRTRRITWGGWCIRRQAGLLGIFKGEDHLDVAPMAWDAPELPICRGAWKRERRRLLSALFCPAEEKGTVAQPESTRNPGTASPGLGSLEGLSCTKRFWRSARRAHGGHQNLHVEVGWRVGAILAEVQRDGKGVPAHNAQSRRVSCQRKGRLRKMGSVPSLPPSPRQRP